MQDQIAAVAEKLSRHATHYTPCTTSIDRKLELFNRIEYLQHRGRFILQRLHHLDGGAPERRQQVVNSDTAS